MALGPRWRKDCGLTKTIRLDFWAVFLWYFDCVELSAYRRIGSFAAQKKVQRIVKNGNPCFPETVKNACNLSL